MLWYCTVVNMSHYTSTTKLQAWCWIKVFIVNYSYSYRIKVWTINLGCLFGLYEIYFGLKTKYDMFNYLGVFHVALFPRSIWFCHDSVFSLCKSVSIPLTLTSYHTDKTTQLCRGVSAAVVIWQQQGFTTFCGGRENLHPGENSVIVGHLTSFQADNQLSIV